MCDSLRFVGASGTDLTIKIFDLRWNRPYHHTSELSCNDGVPFPPPRQPFLSEPPDPTGGRAVCDSLLGRLCRWHALSRQRYYRPNAKLFLVDPHGAHFTSTRRIWSLARPSPISPNFYLGISGGIIEASLEASLDPPGIVVQRVRRDANFAFTDWDSHDQGALCSYVSRMLVPGVQEIGDGLASPHNQRPIKLPPLVSARDWAMQTSSDTPEEWKARHRFDRCFQRMDDFTGFSRVERKGDGRIATLNLGDSPFDPRWAHLPASREN